MSSSKFGVPSIIDVPPSVPLTALLIGAHAIAAVAAATLPFSWFAIGPVLLLVAFSGVRSVRLHGLRSAAPAVVRLAHAADGMWTLTRRDGRVDVATLRAGSFVHPMLLVLNFQTERLRNVAVVMLTAGAVPDDVRRLRATLKWNDNSVE